MSDLKTLLAEVDDITDPTCMDWVLIFYEELKDEDEKYMEILTQNFGNEPITWEQPWYQRSYSITRPRLKERIDYVAEKYATDSLSKAEGDKIAKNWRKLVKKYKIPDKIMCFARWRNDRKNNRTRSSIEETARRFVTAYLARGLERTLEQVYRYVVMTYAAPVKGYYSPIEEKIMEIVSFHEPGKVVPILSIVLGREPRGLYKRLFFKSNGKPEKKWVKWTLQLSSKLLKNLVKHTGLPVKKLKNKMFEKSVWLQVESSMGQSYTSLQSFWYAYLHVQLFVKRKVELNRLRRKLLKKFLSPKYNYQVWTDIRWKEIVKQFSDGFTPQFLSKSFSNMFKDYGVQNRLKAPLEDVVKFGLDKLKSYPKRNLKTVRIASDGELEYFTYENKNIKADVKMDQEEYKSEQNIKICLMDD